MNKYFNILSICALFLCTSCEKETLDNSQDNGNGEAIPVNFVIGSMTDMEEVQGTRSVEYATQTFTQPLDPKEDTGFNVKTTIEMLPYAEDVQTRSSAVSTGVIFRMEVFDTAGNSVSNGLFKVAGTSATLIEGTAPVLAPGTYNFVSYTFNMTEKDKEMTLDSSGYFQPWPKNGVLTLKDFAIFSQRKTISATDNTVAINFKRQKSTIEFSAKAGDQTVSFTEVIRSIPRLIYWNINGNTNESNFWTTRIEATEHFTPNTVNDIIPFSDVALGNERVGFTINGLNINGENYGTKVINAPLNIQPNKRYRIVFNFEPVPPSIVVCGITWAPGNLKVEGDNYFFASNQREFGSYLTAPFNESNDPCRKVTPLNKWRMPTAAEFKTLKNNGLHMSTSEKGLELNSLFLPSQGYKSILGELSSPADAIYPSIDRNKGNDNLYANTQLWGVSNNSNIEIGLLDLIDGHSMSIRCVRNK